VTNIIYCSSCTKDLGTHKKGDAWKNWKDGVHAMNLASRL